LDNVIYIYIYIYIYCCQLQNIYINMCVYRTLDNVIYIVANYKICI